MSKLKIPIAALLLWCLPCPAETLKTGGRTISYKAPDGFVEAENVWTLRNIKTTLQNNAPPGYEVLAFYVDPSALDAYHGGGVLERYLVIGTGAGDNKRDTTVEEFAGFMELIRNTFPRAKNGKVKRKVATTLAKAAPHRLERTDFTDTTEWHPVSGTAITQSMLVPSEYALSGQQLRIPVAQTVTYLLADGKFLSVRQYRKVSTPDEYDAFTEWAAGVLVSMEFPQGAAPPAPEPLGVWFWKGALAACLVIVAVASLAGLALLVLPPLLRRKSGTGPPSGASPPPDGEA